ncbi:MAG TPA: hypothetical protein VMT69_05190 [Kineosporiaceae bacterium]|nr:hypothetical protein [Kineosporiaceae bacterium]
MNVSGVGATPPPPPLPPVTATAPAVATASSDARPRSAERGAGGGAAGHPVGRPSAQSEGSRTPSPEAPPLRMITVTELRVMLGQLPVSAALRPENDHTAS